LLFGARQDMDDIVVDDGGAMVKTAGPYVSADSAWGGNSWGADPGQGGVFEQVDEVSRNEESDEGRLTANGNTGPAPGAEPPAGSEAGEWNDAERDAEEEGLVDAILSRLHAEGLESLTPRDRELLQRASARYRSRLGRRA